MLAQFPGAAINHNYRVDSLNDTIRAKRLIRDSLQPVDTSAVKDTVLVSSLRDTVLASDTTLIKDSLFNAATDTSKQRGFLTQPAFSEARDSMKEDFKNGKKMMYYYGDVSVKYGNLELTAEYMAYDMNTKTVFAAGVRDTAGVLQGRPVMTEGVEKYTMDTLRYNFDTKKAIIINMVTQENEIGRASCRERL